MSEIPEKELAIHGGRGHWPSPRYVTMGTAEVGHGSHSNRRYMREQLRSILPDLLHQTPSAGKFDWLPAGADSRIVDLLESLLEKAPQ